MWNPVKIYGNLHLTLKRAIRGVVLEADSVVLESQFSDLYMSANEIEGSEVFSVLSVRSGSGERTVQLNRQGLDEFANLARRIQTVVRQRAS